MAVSRATNMPYSLHRRLLSDIAELQQTPYPNIHFFTNDANIYKACIILTPEGGDALHLTIDFPSNYPLCAPNVTIQSTVVHPNVFGDYICATILNTEEGWTSAYTLKGIIIQLLSFFCSDNLEQDHGGYSINIAQYRRKMARHSSSWEQSYDWFSDDDRMRTGKDYSCDICNFGSSWKPPPTIMTASDSKPARSTALTSPRNPQPASIIYPDRGGKVSKLFTLPDEIILLILAQLDMKDVFALADAIPTLREIVYSYDLVRLRELRCFCLKDSFRQSKLGIGVSITAGRRPVFRSEFDLLSQEAFFQHEVRRSVQGVEFEKWLPLPLSNRHWNWVKGTAVACLKSIHRHALMADEDTDYVDVLYHFMNNVVVQFSADTEKGFDRPDARSTLSHASEKAVEAYVALFHLLLCLAVANPAIVNGANRVVTRFRAGTRNKANFPDLGHVLVAALISDTGLTEDLILLIIKEAILRNVVWMLDSKGAGMAEMAYLEPSAVSDYRLTKTYNASPTSYRLLMFLKLFSTAVRPSRQPLVEIRDALFVTHSAPSPGTSTIMAERIRQIRKIDGFPGFLVAMGIKNIPSKSEFTTFLRRTIADSKKAGYSRIPMTQSQLYIIRKAREPSVELAQGVVITSEDERWFQRGEKWYDNGWKGRPTFFPSKSKRVETTPRVTKRTGRHRWCPICRGQCVAES